jgi:mono/diheme cytochrome c family protein
VALRLSNPISSWALRCAATLICVNCRTAAFGTGRRRRATVIAGAAFISSDLAWDSGSKDDRARLPAIMAFTAVAMQAGAADNADEVAKGHRLALEICSACHIRRRIKRRDRLHKSAPSLETLANKPGATAPSVQKFLLTIHLSLANGKEMPNPELNEDQARDLAAYVMSLRRAKE